MSIQPILPIMPLGALNPLTPTALETTPRVSSGEGAHKAGADFSKFLGDALREVDALQTKADTAGLALAAGQVQDLSEVMVALEKASLSLSLTVAARDKVIDAYNQIMRMQI
ncbi:flagellar hook-basal body complex protein FliE [Desulfosporosinus youngiae]|uniref:Flagellar hook-basal body complex protein FliE n=1 Tax=Desulfosporosinus youngiae DSM 17734 TaxID=768710 RepID=H5XYR1_9FIRM|nr:flagellar hook-basal body complex protein FliE [Desulfosporosinus youngiae]EHQ91617.1 flagellar hook-basal body complex protein FliE [Desulfosporosinus youngiae DSM 17734]